MGRVDVWHVIAVLLFVLAALITFRDVLQAGPMSSAMVSNMETRLPISEGDVIFEAWLTARNARTLATAPHQLFDTPHCAPATRTLTLGVPMITMGLLAIPVALFTENPALAYNFATFVLLVLSALAMYLLVREWTGVPAAGVVAGLLYAFNPIRVGINITHPSVWDSAWLVFALFFSGRLFAHGRWRDAVGLALACSLQIGASFYPLLAAAMMAPVFAGWLVYQYGFRSVRISQLVFVFVVIAIAVALLLGPYLDAREAGEIGGRSTFYYARWSALLPGGALFLGWGVVILGLIGSCVPRDQLSEKLAGDPRWALAIGAVVTTAIAAGPFNNQILHLIWPGSPFQIPNLYMQLVSFIPGLDSIRLVLRLIVAFQVAFCIFAGVGAAWLMKRSGNREMIVSSVMIALALLSIIPEPDPRETVEVRVDPEEIRFFEELDAMGNRGPILEVPFLTGIGRSLEAPKRILPAVYHHRRMSTCFGSFRAPERELLAELVAELPESGVIEELRQLGFTTLVLNKRAVMYALVIKQKIQRGTGKRIRLLLENEMLAAYDLL
jgi:hypothetical protein